MPRKSLAGPKGPCHGVGKSTGWTDKNPEKARKFRRGECHQICHQNSLRRLANSPDAFLRMRRGKRTLNWDRTD